MKRKWFLMFAVLMITVMVSISVGSVNVPFDAIISIIFNPSSVTESQQQYVNIINVIRIPRVFTVMLVGMALSLSGAVMQGLLKNPLADGSTLGVSSGAALGAILTMILGWVIPIQGLNMIFIGASLGAFLSMMGILAFARLLDQSFSNATLILVGIIYSMLTSSIMSLLIAMSGEKLRNIVFWSMGSLAGTTYSDVKILLGVIIVCLAVLFWKARDLNAFALGEDQARNIGVDVVKSRIILLVVVSVLIGASVAIAGTIAFVGLIIPHITRRISGPNHITLFINCFFVGGTFLMLADLFARTILAPQELPIGVITALIGTILFLMILVKEKREER